MRSDRRNILNIGSVLIAGLLVITLFSLVVPSADEAEGWTSEKIYAVYSQNSITTSGCYRQHYSGSPETTLTYSSPVVGRSVLDNYRGVVSFPIDDIDQRTYINSGSVSLNIDHLGYSSNLYAYILDVDSLAGCDYDSVAQGRYLDRNYISGDTTWTLTFDSTDLDIIRNRIEDGKDLLYIGLRYYESGSSSTIYNYCYVRSYSPYSYLTLSIDDSAPSVPTMEDLDEYTEGSSATLEYGGSYDLPLLGNYGSISYQTGVFDNETSSEPIYTSPWTSATSYTFNSLADGQEYHFRARAKDGLGFIGSWSSVQSTTMDSAPPTVPGLFSEPGYTIGTENQVIWSPSTDTASGIDFYAVFIADNPELTDAVGAGTTDNFYTFTNLDSGTTYYYVVFAQDAMGHRSQLSSMESSMQDDTDPSIPVMMREPAYTQGSKNRFEWHPSNDIGIGIKNYTYELATSEDFSPGSIIDRGTVAEPFFVSPDLMDGTRYWARVKARDGFGHESDWSRAEWSIQDMTGPGELGLREMDLYSPDDPIKLEWNAAEDAGSGTGWYKVVWSKDPTFTTGVNEIDHVIGHSYTISGLDTGSTWYFRVISYDGLGNEGEMEETYTTIDPAPPTIPDIDDLPTFSSGRSNLISWSESTDALSGLDHYVLDVYTSASRLGRVFSVHTTETEFEVPGLSDGTTYYYEVTAMDRAGNIITSEPVHSIQDALGPSVPYMVEMEPFSTEDTIDVQWEVSLDEGMGEVQYQVEWSFNEIFTELQGSSPWLTKRSYTIMSIDDTRAPDHLPDGHYFIRVRARDGGGSLSSFSPVFKVTVDTKGPEPGAVIHSGFYFGGSTAKIGWSMAGSVNEEVKYQVTLHEDEDGHSIFSSPWVEDLEYVLTNLDGGKKYWVRIWSRDEAGNMGIIDPVYGNTRSIHMDNTPPRFTIDNNGIFGGSDLYLSGEAEDTQCGMDSVQISFDEGLTWTDCTMTNEKWSYSIDSVPETNNDFMVRAIDMGGNIGDSIHGKIDLRDPLIDITYPEANSIISGPVQLMGSIEDENLESFKVEYKGPDSTEWKVIIPMQTTTGFSGILGTWLTSGLEGGEYTIRVTAEDELGQISTEERILNIGGANILLDPSMVTFSNSHPASGERVTVFLTLTNLGESPASGLTVTLYDGDEPIGTTNDVTVPARGSTIVTGELKASGSHDITAEVSSSSMDPIEMKDPAVLETVEDEMIMENIGGILGLLALILAIIAILLALFLGLRKGKEDEEKTEPKEAGIREKPKDDASRRAASLSGGVSPQQRPGLPAGQTQERKQEQPALPGPSIAPVSMPKQEEKTEATPAPTQPSPRAPPVQYVAPNRKH